MSYLDCFSFGLSVVVVDVLQLAANRFPVFGACVTQSIAIEFGSPL